MIFRRLLKNGDRPLTTTLLSVQLFQKWAYDYEYQIPPSLEFIKDVSILEKYNVVCFNYKWHSTII